MTAIHNMTLAVSSADPYILHGATGHTLQYLAREANLTNLLQSFGSSILIQSQTILTGTDNSYGSHRPLLYQDSHISQLYKILIHTELATYLGDTYQNTRAYSISMAAPLLLQCNREIKDHYQDC